MNETVKLGPDVGRPIKRVEDFALVRGRGRFMDDIVPEGVLVSHVLRSNVGHARIKLGDLAAARELPGVHLVLTAKDIAGTNQLPVRVTFPQPDGSRPKLVHHPVLAEDAVRYVGEAIAFIVAESVEIAKDAAELIDVDYDTLPAVVDGRAALRKDAPLLRPERGTNLAYEYHLGDRARTDAAFAKAAHVTRIHLINNRVSAAYMETRGVVAEYDAGTERYQLHVSCQNSHLIRKLMAEEMLRIDEKRVRVLVPDVGGAFGAKIAMYPEYVLAAIAAERIGRPVKWIGERTEQLLADKAGRDQDTIMEMAMDRDGRFLALRSDGVANIGAYMSEMGAFVPFNAAKMATGSYDIPTMFCSMRGVFTNTAVTDAYRGAGRPEGAFHIERLVDQCAVDMKMDPAAIRRLNFIKPEQMPYKTPSGFTYDCGDFDRHFTLALALAEADGFPARAEAARKAGRARGLGIAAHIDACVPPGKEVATIRLEKDGTATLLVGTQTGGQGHATAYAQFMSGPLGLSYDKIRTIQGDTDQVRTGGGTGGSRSIPIAAPSIVSAAGALAEKIKSIASGLLEAAPADLELGDGMVRVAGTNRAVSLADVAAAAKDPADITAADGIETSDRTFPNGTHICEVEIDPDTGKTSIVNYVVVDDVGLVVNPDLLTGQIVGGIAQGVGQAMLERVFYNDEGQLLSASFQDYCMPRAEDFTHIEVTTENVPSPNNPLGIKGVGEAGCMGSCPAVMNAIADALRRSGVSAWVDMPATPERVWSLLAAKA